jgi:hypothetical protein
VRAGNDLPVILQDTAEEQVIEVGDWVEGMVVAWSNAAKEERRDMLRLMLDAVYVDLESAKVVTLKPKPAFLPLFRLDGQTKAGDLALVPGDPEGIRGPHAQWAFVIRVARAEELLWAQSLTA